MPDPSRSLVTWLEAIAADPRAWKPVLLGRARRRPAPGDTHDDQPVEAPIEEICVMDHKCQKCHK
eukprot:12569188-Alexandrium_andersonii.AAC.1